MLHYYINKEWIVSLTARRIYRSTAIFSLALFLVLFLFPYMEEMPGALRSLVKLTFFASILATAVTFIAMEYFFFTVYEASAPKMIFWFLVLGLLAIGPALFCFTVYSKISVPSKLESDPNLASRAYES